MINSKPATNIYRILHDIKGKVFAKISLDNLSFFPIPKCIENDRNLLGSFGINQVKLKNELKNSSEKFQRTILRKFNLTELSSKLESWYLIDYKVFIIELVKKKIKLSLADEAEWEEYFLSESKKVQAIKAEIDKTDKEIDTMVYQLYELTDEEIKIVEGT